MRRHTPMGWLVAFLLAALIVAPAAEGNGNLPASALARISAHPCEQLALAPAAAFNSMRLAAHARHVTIGVNGCDSAYRPFARQVFWRNVWCSRGNCGNAAVPGTSNHGNGYAIDVDPVTRAFIDHYGRLFGFCKCWSDAPQESWHVLYQDGHFDRPNPGVSIRSPRLSEGSGGPGQGRRVAVLQRRLRVHGYVGVPVDGEYGPKTRKAVLRLQGAHKIPADGIVGATTWRVLRHPPGPRSRPKPKPAPKPHPVKKPRKPHRKVRGKVKGVDVSSNNGPGVNWRELKHAGYAFAFAKVNEGDWHDPTFGQARWAAMGAAGLIRGGYDYLRPRAGRTGAVEASIFLDSLRIAGWGRGDLPPAADIETTALSPAGTCVYLRSWVQRVHQVAHVWPIIYTGRWFSDPELPCGKWLGRLRLWHAEYGPTHPTVGRAWAGHPSAPWAWQFTGSGTAPGVAGHVDIEIAQRARVLRARVR